MQKKQTRTKKREKLPFLCATLRGLALRCSAVKKFWVDIIKIKHIEIGIHHFPLNDGSSE
jgi:hypothetical protein